MQSKKLFGHFYIVTFIIAFRCITSFILRFFNVIAFLLILYTTPIQYQFRQACFILNKIYFLAKIIELSGT